jgi:cell division protein FtsB
VRQAAEGARNAAAVALGARDDVVTVAAALRDGLADQQRQLEELQAKTAELRRTIKTPDPK